MDLSTNKILLNSYASYNLSRIQGEEQIKYSGRELKLTNKQIKRKQEEE